MTGWARGYAGVLLVWFVFIASATAPARADEAGWKALKAGGRVVLIRHGQTTPGSGDPEGFRLEDCATQRNLVDEGREQARRIGQLLRERGIAVDRVLSSAWCRCLETARLLDVGEAAVEPALNNLFGRPERQVAQTTALRELILAWSGPGNLVLVTHGVNVRALTDIAPRIAEGVVLSPAPMADEGFRYAGRIAWEDR